MNDDVRDELVPADVEDAPSRREVDGPLSHAFGRRAVLQSLASGVGVAALASPAAAHVHQAATPAAAKPATPAARAAAAPALAFLDKHAFETLTALAEQIVPGARAAKVPEFLDRLLAVESQQTQKRVVSALGAFEREARQAHGRTWKALSAADANALLTKISTAPADEAIRGAFETIKSAVAETYFSSQAGMKELGWKGGVMFATPAGCGPASA